MNRKTGRAALYPVLTHAQQCYLALRAGLGHVEVIGGRARRDESTTYRLTPAGRAACPSRRAVEREEVAA